jgi:hypothetical protein
MKESHEVRPSQSPRPRVMRRVGQLAAEEKGTGTKKRDRFDIGTNQRGRESINKGSRPLFLRPPLIRRHRCCCPRSDPRADLGKAV